MSFAFWILQPKGGGEYPVLNSELGPDLGCGRLNAISAISNVAALSSQRWFGAKDFGSLLLLDGVGRIGGQLDQSGAFQSP